MLCVYLPCEEGLRVELVELADHACIFVHLDMSIHGGEYVSTLQNNNITIYQYSVCYVRVALMHSLSTTYWF